MDVVDSLQALKRDRPVVLTIGAFDGVHLGHQYLMRQVVERARALDYLSAIVTFDPRPQVVLRPGSQQLTDAAEKERMVGVLGPDVLVVLPFTHQLASVPAAQFLQSILDHINLAEVWVGADFAFGHEREGNVDFLIRAGQANGFAVHVVARQTIAGASISSTSARALIKDGDVEGAAEILGHYLRIRGPVVRGAGRGAGLGFPTANVRPDAAQVLPATGIYAGFLTLNGDAHDAAISVGFNPQFQGQELVVEAYLLDFEGDLRDRVVALDFVQYIRAERAFESVEALAEAIAQDVLEVRRILAKEKAHAAPLAAPL
ncbi:MAG: bifunctional riboflavin kinase/FAD synthetase [Chloroflexota bacterium]